MHPLLRKVVLHVLPRPVMQRLRCWHAPRMAVRFTDKDWPPAPLIRALIQPGDTVMDVGANMGYITARLAEYVGATGRVYAVEPVPDTFALLEATVRALALEQVTPLHVCASNEAGEVYMEIPSYSEGGENLYESHVLDGSALQTPVAGRRVAVRAVRLDDLIDGPRERLTFMKIDVEGHERAVMQGAREILEQCAPALFIEVSGDPDDPVGAAAKLFADLSAVGYAPFLWDGTILRPRKKGDVSVDYFFLQPVHVERLAPWLAGSSSAAGRV